MENFPLMLLLAASRMIIKLKIECISGSYFKDECIRLIALDDSTSLYGLHYEILKAVGFEDDHLFAFFTANSGSPFADRNYLNYDERLEVRAAFFEKTQLSEIWPLGSKKLYYRFDFGDDWIFEIRKMRTLKTDASIDAPQILERIGENIEQYPTCEEW